MWLFLYLELLENEAGIQTFEEEEGEGEEDGDDAGREGEEEGGIDFYKDKNVLQYIKEKEAGKKISNQVDFIVFGFKPQMKGLAKIAIPDSQLALFLLQKNI